MNIAEVRAKSKDELKEQLLTLKREQFNLRFQAAAGETVNQSRPRQIRRTVARIKMALGEQNKKNKE